LHIPAASRSVTNLVKSSKRASILLKVEPYYMLSSSFIESGF